MRVNVLIGFIVVFIRLLNYWLIADLLASQQLSEKERVLIETTAAVKGAFHV